MSIIEGIRGPADVKRLSMRELYRLAAEIRGLIVETVTRNGGHLASNLGVVELTLALHRVFSTPADSIVWDVGHQCYAHKIVTGRYAAFSGIRKSGGLSGFPRSAESVHDAFDAGHASTSISAALGLLAAKRARGDGSSVIAVIGDGALTGGMAYEALSHAGQMGLPLIVVLNDNEMSISHNVGAVSRYLSRRTASVRYQRFRHLADKVILGFPLIGPSVHPVVLKVKHSIKALFFRETLFSDLGFEYAGPIDGHNIQILCEVLSAARDIRKPIVVHVMTKKGKGHDLAEDDPASWHGLQPASPAAPAGAAGTVPAAPRRPSFTEAFGSAIVEAAAADPRVVAVTAAMASGTGLSAFQARFPGRFFDVGIAEEHAVTFAAGMAAGGQKPVVALYSTFTQRAFDQVHHDVALAGRPVVFAVDRAGAVPDDGETHQGIYDVQAFRAVPGLAILAPASALELASALRWALASGGPAMIRYPKAVCPPERPAYEAPFEPGHGVFVRQACRVSHAGSARISERQADALFVASGALVEEAVRASDILASGGSFAADVYYLRFLKPLDAAAFARLCEPYRLVVIAEEGVLTGSVAADLAAAVNAGGGRALALAFPERPFPQAHRAELLDRAGLSAEGLARAALAALGDPVAGDAPAAVEAPVAGETQATAESPVVGAVPGTGKVRA